jgi:hypothetical protein
MRVPAASPVAITLTRRSGLVVSDRNEIARIKAALVTRRPVRARRLMTAPAVVPLRSYSSRIRARMNTS